MDRQSEKENEIQKGEKGQNFRKEEAVQEVFASPYENPVFFEKYSGMESPPGWRGL